jgi:hypothetical protein
MTNVTISQNRAGSGTGGLDHGGIDTAFRLDSVTVASNHSDGSVGGVTNILSQILITNSILISNTNPSSEWDCAGVFVSGGYNLVGATGGTCNSIDDFNQPSDIVNVPGLLASLAGKWRLWPYAHAALWGDFPESGGGWRWLMPGSRPAWRRPAFQWG